MKNSILYFERRKTIFKENVYCLQDFDKSPEKKSLQIIQNKMYKQKSQEYYRNKIY